MKNFGKHAVWFDGEVVHILHHVEESPVVSGKLLIRLTIIEETSKLFLRKRFPKFQTTLRRKFFTVISVTLQWTALAEDISMRPNVDMFAISG